MVRNVLIAMLEWLAIWNCRALTPLSTCLKHGAGGAERIPARAPGGMGWFKVFVGALLGLFGLVLGKKVCSGMSRGCPGAVPCPGPCSGVPGLFQAWN